MSTPNRHPITLFRFGWSYHADKIVSARKSYLDFGGLTFRNYQYEKLRMKWEGSISAAKAWLDKEAAKGKISRDTFNVLDEFINGECGKYTAATKLHKSRAQHRGC